MAERGEPKRGHEWPFLGLAVSPIARIYRQRRLYRTRMTPERIMDMFEAMAEIEAMCVRLASNRMTPLERSRLIQLHDGSLAMVEADDVDAYDAFNRAFHETLYHATHNAFLAEQAIATRTRLNAFRRTQLRQRGRIVRSREEHEGVLAAIAQGDGETAERRIRAHMLNAASALDRYIADHSGAG